MRGCRDAIILCWFAFATWFDGSGCKKDKAYLTPLPLLNEVRLLIKSARERAAVAVNAELTLLYWQIGRSIRAEVLRGTRAEYGQ